MLKKLPRVVWAIIVALVVELTVCQWDFWGSILNKPIENCNITIHSGGEWNEDGSITITGVLMLLLEDINEEVKYLQLDFRRMGNDGEEVKDGVPVTLYAIDEANSEYYAFGERMIFSDNERSQYMRTHLAGKCETIRIVASALPGEVLYLDDIVCNPHVPIQFSALRYILLFLTSVFIIYARPGKKDYEIVWGESKCHSRITSSVIVMQLVVFVGAVLLNPFFCLIDVDYHFQYEWLAEAFSKGQLYLEQVPPETLISMENPYDTIARERLMAETGEAYLWDVAYYEGKYYVYFGVLPVLIYYLPYYLLTGSGFPTWMGIALTGMVFVAAAFYLSEIVVKKYFNGKIPYITWLLSTVLAVNGCGVIMAMRRPDFYSLPILMGVTFSLIGLSFWISSLEKDRVNTWKLIAGCFCMALVAACRPQLLLGSLLIFPIYWDAVFKKRWLFSKKSIGKTVGAVMAYVVVAIPLMLYNYVRFDSPFQFGAIYNLTTNDMTRRGIELARIPEALFKQLFQLPNITAEFPYIQTTSTWTSYMGKVISEPTFGGFLVVNLLPLAGLIIVFRKHWFQNKKLWITASLLYAFAIGIICIDAEVAGVLPRYILDFGWLFYIAAILVWFSAWQHNSTNSERIYLMQVGQNMMFCIGMAFAFLIIFVDGDITIKMTNPQIFYEFYYQLAFWA